MKKKIVSGYYLVLLLLPFITQCTIEKRHYTKGFYVSSLKKIHPARPSQKEKEETPVVKNISVAVEQIPVYKKPFEATAPVILYASAKKINTSTVAVKKLNLPPDSCSDQITFMNGEELKVKIEEISPDYIAYRRCDYLTGPLMKTSIGNLFRIKYGNGFVKVFTHDRPVATQPVNKANKPVAKQTNKLGLSAFVISLFSWLIIPGPIALGLGIGSLSQFKKHPEKYKGKWLAVVGTVLGAIGTFILIVVIIGSL